MNPELDPHEELERAIIGIALQSKRDLNDLGAVRAEWFANPVHEGAWRIIHRLRESGQDIDPLIVAANTQHADEIVRRQITPTFLLDCQLGSPAGHLGRSYAKQLGEQHRRNQLTSAVVRAQQMLDEGADAQTIRLETLDALSEVQDEYADLESVGDTIDATVASFYEATSYVPTPWNGLNKAIRGWRPGGLYIVGGRPGVGKSLILQRVALDLANTGPVLLETMEMNPHEVNRRLVATLTGVEQSRMNGLDAKGLHSISKGAQESISRASDKLKKLPLTYGLRAQEVTDIREHARALNRRQPLAGICVDYLQLMSIPGFKGGRVQEITQFTRQLKQLAMEFDCPVIVASQLNRNSANERRAPHINELRDSGSIEQDADVVMLLHEDPELAFEDPDEGKDLDLIIAKNRQGTTQRVLLRKFGRTATVGDDDRAPISESVGDDKVTRNNPF